MFETGSNLTGCYHVSLFGLLRRLGEGSWCGPWPDQALRKEGRFVRGSLVLGMPLWLPLNHLEEKVPSDRLSLRKISYADYRRR